MAETAEEISVDPQTQLPPPREVLNAAMNEFVQVRVEGMARTGLDPAATAVNLSVMGIQVQALLELLMGAEIVSESEFAGACAAVAMRQTERLRQQSPKIEIATALG